MSSPQLIPYHKSIDGLEPNHIIIRLAQAPTQEVIAQKIQAMQVSAITNPPITNKSFNHTMQAWKEKFDENFAMMGFTINLNTD